MVQKILMDIIHGRGYGKAAVFIVTLTKTKSLTIAISGYTGNGTTYNAIGKMGIYKIVRN